MNWMNCLKSLIGMLIVIPMVSWVVIYFLPDGFKYAGLVGGFIGAFVTQIFVWFIFPIFKDSKR